jgi:hypothetical protein
MDAERQTVLEPTYDQQQLPKKMKQIRKWLVPTIYHDGYIVHLPKTDDGFKIHLKASKTEVTLWKIIMQHCREAPKHLGDIMSDAEKEKIIRPGDILLAVEDIDVTGMKIGEVTEFIASKSTEKSCIVKMTWRNIELLNSMRCKHVKKGTVLR